MGHTNEEINNSILANQATLEQREDSGWQVKKFANKLKDIICILIGCTRADLESQEFKSKKLGEEWVKNNASGDYKDGKIVKYLFPEKDILTPRKLLQLVGTDCIRNIVHKDAWVNALFAEYKLEEVLPETDTNLYNYIPKYKYPNWIIDDVRFDNEYQAIKSRGGLLIRVNRASDNKDEHKSETELDKHEFKWTINNNGTLEELIEQVRIILIKENIIK